MEGVDGAKREVQSFGDSLGNAARNMGVAGAAMTAGLTAPIIGLVAAANAAGTALNRELGNVQSLGITQERVLELKTVVQELGIETGTSTASLANGLYEVISAFGDTADTEKILEINAKAAAAGLATINDALALTSSVTKSYGDVSAEAVQHTADLAFVAVNLGQTTFPELASNIGQVVPLSVALGVSQEELFAIMATGTGVTGNTSEVATQYRGILQSLMAPTDTMTQLIQANGAANGAALRRTLGLAGAINLVVKASEETNTPLQKYIGSIEGQTLALSLAGPQAEAYIRNLAAMVDATGANEAAFAAQTQGVNAAGFAAQQAGVKWEVFLQKLNDGMAPAKTAVIDALTPMMDKALEWADAFAKADEDTQMFILSLVGIAAAAGPVLLALSAVVGAIATIGLPMLAIGIGVGLLAAAWATNWGDMQTKTQTAIDAIVPIIGGVRAAIDLLWASQNKDWAGTADAMQRLMEALGPSKGFEIGVKVNEFSAQITKLRGQLETAGTAFDLLWASQNKDWAGTADAMQRLMEALGSSKGFEIGVKVNEFSAQITKLRGQLETAGTAIQNFFVGIGTAFSNTTFPTLDELWLDFQGGDFETIAEKIKMTTFQLMVNLNAELDIKGKAKGLQDALNAQIGMLTGNLETLLTAVTGFATTLVTGIDATAIAGAATALVEGFSKSIVIATSNTAKLGELGTAVGTLVRSIVTKFGEILAAPDFSADIGTAVGKATAAMALGAAALVTGIVNQIAVTDWSTFVDSIADFSQSFIAGVAGGLASADYGPIVGGLFTGIGAALGALIKANPLSFFNMLGSEPLPLTGTKKGQTVAPMSEFIADGPGWAEVGTSIVNAFKMGMASFVWPEFKWEWPEQPEWLKGWQWPEWKMPSWIDFLAGLISKIPGAGRGGATQSIVNESALRRGESVTFPVPEFKPLPPVNFAPSGLEGPSSGWPGFAEMTPTVDVVGKVVAIEPPLIPPTVAVTPAWTIPQGWGGLSGMTGAGGMGAGMALNWADYVTALNWADYVTELTWADLVPDIKWATFVTKLIWTSFLDRLSWNEFVKDIKWSSFVSDLSWGQFVPNLNWGAFIPSMAGGGGSSGGSAGAAPGSGAPGDPLLSTPNAPSPWDVYPTASIAAAGAGGPTVQFTGPVYISNMGDIEHVADMVIAAIRRRG